MKREKAYDMTRKAGAVTGLVLRAAIAGYLAYLAWHILRGAQKGGSPIPEWGAWLICLAFAAAAAGFCLYAWRAYQKGLKAAELSDDSPVTGGDSECSGASGRGVDSEEPENQPFS